MDHADAVPIAELLDERRYLLDVAYWMLGSPGAAESVVDETYRRWYALSDAEHSRITAPRSWLAKTAGGICLGRLSLPGRGTATEADAPRAQADKEGLEEEVGQVLLHALDLLSPAERAAFVLNDVFGLAPARSPTSSDVPNRSVPNWPTGPATVCGSGAHVPRHRRSRTPSPAPSARPARARTPSGWPRCCPRTPPRSSTAAARYEPSPGPSTATGRSPTAC